MHVPEIRIHLTNKDFEQFVRSGRAVSEAGEIIIKHNVKPMVMLETVMKYCEDLLAFSAEEQAAYEKRREKLDAAVAAEV